MTPYASGSGADRRTAPTDRSTSHRPSRRAPVPATTPCSEWSP
ncbi:hypothetical protein BN2537_16207 [Streptomyces venezuelae]|nr:hypothetical protein BN2537_16207 [Streptomyces venezuelae]